MASINSIVRTFVKKETGIVAREATASIAKGLAPNAKGLKSAERFLASSGDTLLGVRNNVAVVQNRAPFNKSLMMTSFYDNITGQWLKTKYVTNGKLSYLPLGISSTGCHIPKEAQSAIQKLDIFPEALGDFKTKSNCVTRFFDNFGLTGKTQIKARGTGRNLIERIVKQEVTNGRGKYTVLEPVSIPNNGSVSGYINETNGNIVRSIRKLV